MTRLCHRYIKNESETMEVVSEGFVKVFSNLGRFNYERAGGLTSWIKTIMVNESLQHLRKHQHMYVDIQDESIDVISVDSELKNFEAEYIYQAILKLPEGYRTVFNLNVVEGYSHKEIAEKLGISEGASRSQLTHAKKKLQLLLNEHKVS